jgi:hypothetical protein
VRWDFGYCGHYWPIVPAPDDRWWWLWINWWNKDWQRKPEYSEKTCPSATLSTTNSTWLDPVLNPGLRGGKSATNRFSYAAASSSPFLWMFPLDRSVTAIGNMDTPYILNFFFNMFQLIEPLSGISLLYLHLYWSARIPASLRQVLLYYNWISYVFYKMCFIWNNGLKVFWTENCSRLSLPVTQMCLSEFCFYKIGVRKYIIAGTKHFVNMVQELEHFK